MAALRTGGAVINCCSLGILNIIGSKGLRDRTAVITIMSSSTIKNCYYINGVPGNTGINVSSQEPNAILFYETSNNPTTNTVVAALNSYIESNEDEVDTTGWCKWVVGEKNLPALDFNTEWNGTAWVRASN